MLLVLLLIMPALLSLAVVVFLAKEPKACYALLTSTLSYWRGLAYFFRGGSYEHCPYFSGEDEVQARVNLYSLWLIFHLWGSAHYRNGTFRDDMVKNLRNVAIPGTGIPLSTVVFMGKPVVMLYIIFCYPMIALAAALHAKRQDPETEVHATYREQLLYPKVRKVGLRKACGRLAEGLREARGTLRHACGNSSGQTRGTDLPGAAIHLPAI